jgi:hypothetical protein
MMPPLNCAVLAGLISGSHGLFGTPLCTFPLVMQIPDKKLSTLLRIPRGSGFIPQQNFLTGLPGRLSCLFE